MNETTIAILGLLACGFTGLVASTRTFLTVTMIFMVVLAFGPVAYRYVETGDGSLIWEAVFRAALFAVAAFGAKAFCGLDSRGGNHS